MSDVDYSQMRSIADEPHWNTFVQSVGGELVSPLIKRQGVQNADYLFRSAKVIAELKVLETEFAHSKEMLAKVDALIAKYPGIDPDDPTQPLRRELLLELKKPLQRIINKANRQIKETKAELGLHDYRGVLICVNDNFRGAPPGLVRGLIGHILAGTSYKSITAVIYQTNHYVELVELPYAALLWAPMYSDEAGSDLVEFINDLGRRWRAYAERLEGPYDFSEERPHVRLEEATVVSGVLRNKRFQG
ncbi:MAG: hypothetical protein JWO72_2078 [Caulobacteraceae bacterium]|nr:hypothetical protein [Caulobacteraceae bacterium]